jgi:hypothetical protein
MPKAKNLSTKSNEKTTHELGRKRNYKAGPAKKAQDAFYHTIEIEHPVVIGPLTQSQADVLSSLSKDEGGWHKLFLAGMDVMEQEADRQHRPFLKNAFSTEQLDTIAKMIGDAVKEAFQTSTIHHDFSGIQSLAIPQHESQPGVITLTPMQRVWLVVLRDQAMTAEPLQINDPIAYKNMQSLAAMGLAERLRNGYDVGWIITQEGRYWLRDNEVSDDTETDTTKPIFPSRQKSWPEDAEIKAREAAIRNAPFLEGRKPVERDGGDHPTPEAIEAAGDSLEAKHMELLSCPFCGGFRND